MTRLSTIRAVASVIAASVILLFVLTYAVEIVSITLRGAWERPFFYHGNIVSRIMDTCTWMLSSFTLYSVAPLADRLPGIRSSTSTGPFVFSVAGAVLIFMPPLFFISKCLIYAIKITIYGSWASEGRIFIDFNVYPHNMLLILLPWCLSGMFLLLFASDRTQNNA